MKKDSHNRNSDMLARVVAIDPGASFEINGKAYCCAECVVASGALENPSGGMVMVRSGVRATDCHLQDPLPERTLAV